MCNMCMYCQRHKNNGVPNAQAKFLNFGTFAHLPHSFYYKTDRAISNILTELKLIYYLGFDTFQRLYSSFACCMTFIFIKNHANKIILGVLGVYGGYIEQYVYFPNRQWSCCSRVYHRGPI